MVKPTKDQSSTKQRITAFLLSFALAAVAGCGGGNVRPTPERVPPVTTIPPEPETRLTRAEPVHGREINEAFLEEYLAAIKGPVDYSDGEQALLRWRRPPVVKYFPALAADAPNAVEALRFAVAELNTVLPIEMELKWGGAFDAPLRTLTREDFEGLIVVGTGNLQVPFSLGLTLGLAYRVPSNKDTLDGGVLVGLDTSALWLSGEGP